MITFGSLFAGIGGFDLGFERAGMRCEWQVEIDDYCNRVLEKHWPHVRRWRDVRTFPPEPAADWGVDVICGGDPCQANSNTRKHGHVSQPSLGREFIDIVDALQPRIVVRENPTSVRRDAPWPWWRFRSELESLGYAVVPFRLRACCFGAEHRRDRLFLLAEMAYSDTERPQRAIIKEMEITEAGTNRLCPFYGCHRWSSAPRISRRGDGVSHRLDRVGSLGNAVVPQVAEWIGRRIVEIVDRPPGAG
jgi:DNA (cytosine-5)-methyltransferase 1